MVYRLLAAAVVIFWLAMTGLLLRKEFFPGDSSLRVVPVEHVLRMLIQREQASDLQLYNEKTLVGHLRLQPHTRREDGQRAITIAGWLQLAIPGADRQRVTWSAELDLDEALAAQRLNATINLREPTGLTIDLHADFATKRLDVDTHLAGQLARRTSYLLDESGARAWLSEQGLSPALIGTLSPGGAAHAELLARQSTLELHGEKIETDVITAEQSGQTLFEAHVSQLGQILRIRTILGYSAAPEGLTP